MNHDVKPNHGIRGPLADHVVTERVGEPGPDGSIVVSLRFERMCAFAESIERWLGLVAASLPATIPLASIPTDDLVRLFIDRVPPAEAAARLAGELGA